MPMPLIARHKIETRAGVQFDADGHAIAEGEPIVIDAGEEVDDALFSAEELASLRERGVVYASDEMVVERQAPPLPERN